MNIMNRNFYSQKSLRRDVVAGVAVAMLLVSSTTPSIANDPIGDFVHTVKCSGLLISDPERHLIECGVGKMNSTPLAKTGTGNGIDNPPLTCPSGKVMTDDGGCVNQLKTLLNYAI